MKKCPVSRKANLVVQEMDGETLVYDLTENKAFCLNETSALVWQLCDGNNSVDEISKIIGQKLNSSVNKDVVWFALDQLKKERLIENAFESDNYFAGMTRREIVKKIGFGTMIALPVVASVIAPTPILAASPFCSNAGTTCSCTSADRNAGTGNCTSTTCTPNNIASMTTPSCICLGTNPAAMSGTCGVGIN